jgi:hypothetical protein
MKTLKILISILVLISPFIFHVWKKNMVNALNIKISNLTGEVQNLERRVMVLGSKWRRESSPGFIERRAKQILNMRYPERGEIFKIENFNIMGNKDEK